jgi:hypothetical protein
MKQNLRFGQVFIIFIYYLELLEYLSFLINRHACLLFSRKNSSLPIDFHVID